jgi:hypothetical protein
MESYLKSRLTIARVILAVRHAATEHYGSPDTFAILLAIATGSLEGRPLDISSTAALACTSRQSVMRAIKKMHHKDEIEIQRIGRRTLLTVTARRRQNTETQKFFDRVADLVVRCGKELSGSDT